MTAVACNHVFGSFESLERANIAVDTLVGSGFPARAITVMHHDNPMSVNFAKLKGTTAPAGTAHGLTAKLPLEGSLGLMNPAEGPKEGALHSALQQMGVPLDWPHGVLNGKVLVSVECEKTESTDVAKSVMHGLGAEDVGAADEQKTSS